MRHPRARESKAKKREAGQTGIAIAAVRLEQPITGTALAKTQAGPERLRRLDEAASETLRSSKSDHTWRAYGQRWRGFQAWCQELGLQSLPASTRDIVRYMNQMELDGLSTSTIRLARSAIVHAHRLAGVPDAENPARAPVVSETLRSISARTAPQRQARAMLPEYLDAIRSTALIPRGRSNGGTPETNVRAILRGRVDIALCTLMRDAGLRRSEAAAITWGDVEDWPDGSGRLTIVRSKTNRTGEPEVVAITRSGMAALEAIRPAEPPPEQRVFGLSERQIARRIQEAALAAGLGDGFNGHSGRVGLARTMTANGAPVNATMKQGRWKNAQTVARYTRGEDAGAALTWLG